MEILSSVSVIMVLNVVMVALGDQAVPDLQMDQPVRVQPGPSYLSSRMRSGKTRDYAARALEILTIRSRTKEQISRSRQRSFKAETCDQRYKEVSDTHTMCLRDIGKGVRLLETTKDAILSQHNVYRSSVTPIASNMQLMIWDSSLEAVAAKWSRQCRRGHDNSSDRASPDLPGVHVGQNAAYGYRNWEAAMEAWHVEVADFLFGNGSTGGVVGHYTQIVAWRSARIGCGQADCPSSPYKRHFVCNYAVGQMNDDPQTPYREGERCADCKDQCDDAGNLCDCGGKLCLNGGSINLNTCQCKCPIIYSGDACQTLTCPAGDPWYCGSQWPEAYCHRFVNVPLECPYLCAVCTNASLGTPAPSTCQLKCKNGGKADSTKCTCSCREGYRGKRCERKAWRVCEGKTCLNGGQLHTYSCLCACPVGHTGARCETKVRVCEGKVCRNRGRLNTATCECACTRGFVGSTCAERPTSDCPILHCNNGGSLNKTACRCKCPDGFSGKRCHKQRCPEVTCHNGGSVNYADCTCLCPDTFDGTTCKTQITAFSTNVVCDKECQNGGLLDPVTCRCWCPSPFSGSLCDEVDCPESDNEACGNLPESYCPDFFLMRHMCPFKCALCSQRACDPDKWFCNDNYIKPHLCRVVGNYCPSFCGLC